MIIGVIYECEEKSLFVLLIVVVETSVNTLCRFIRRTRQATLTLYFFSKELLYFSMSYNSDA